MSEECPPTGLLSPAEREQLTGPDTDPATRDEIRERVRTRLHETLTDFSLVYPTLRDSDVEAVFCPENDNDLFIVRTATQDALALLVLGMLANDDLLETRLTDAIQYAAVAHGEEVTLDLEIRRSPLPPFEARLARFEEAGLTEQTLPLYEELLWNGDREQAEVASRRLGIDARDEELETLRDKRRIFERMPQMAVTAVELTDPTDTGGVAE